MTSKNPIITTLISGLLISSPIFAADTNWTGLKLGVTVGGVSNKAKAQNESWGVLGSEINANTVSFSKVGNWDHSADYSGFDSAESVNLLNDISGAGEGNENLSESNMFAGLDLTLDYQINENFVMGLVASYDKANQKKAKAVSTGFVSEDISNDFDFGDEGIYGSQVSITNSLSIEDTAALGVRFGYLATPETLLYLSGGYATAKVRASSVFTQGGKYIRDDELTTVQGNYSASDAVSSSGWEHGYFLGAGLQTMMTSNVSFKIEYRYTDYGDVFKKESYGEYNVSAPEGNQISGGGYLYSEIDDLHQNSIRASVVYSF